MRQNAELFAAFGRNTISEREW